MQEKTLVKISFAVTIVGLVLLFFFSEETTIPVQESIEDLPENKQVQMEGIVTNLVKKDTVYFLTIDGMRKERTDIIIFPEEEIYLKEGNVIAVEGIVQRYKGRNEIIASKVRIQGEVKQENKTST